MDRRPPRGMLTRMLLPGEDDLTYIPMAVRRALDRAGLRLSLTGWRSLSLPVRMTLVALGAEPEIEAARVVELTAGARPEPIPPTPEPPADRTPPVVRAVVPIPDASWRALHPVARHALESYARRDKHDKLHALYEALNAPFCA